MEAMAPEEMDQDHRQKSGQEKLEDTVQDQIKAKEQEIRELREEIKVKEEEIRKLREEIRGVKKDMAIASGTEVRKPLEAKLELLRQQLISRDQQIHSRDRQMSSLRHEISIVRYKQESPASSRLIPLFQPKELTGGESDGIKARRLSYFTTRLKTVTRICELVDEKGALLIRAPPGSGKTSILQLVVYVNNLLEGIFKQVYYISLAQIGGRNFDEFLEKKLRDVTTSELQSPNSSSDKHPESDSKSRPTLLLVDEGQVAFGRDLTLWDTAKDCLSGSVKHLRIIIVSAWGSSIIFHDGKRVATPVKFNLDATVGLLPSAKNSVSLQLTKDEAMELWNSWCEKGLEFGDKLAPWDDLRDYVFILTGQQPGLMAHVLDFLIVKGLKNSQPCSMEQKQKARNLLLSPIFYDSLSQIRSLLRIGKTLRGQIPIAESMRSLLRKLLPAGGVHIMDLSGRDREAADSAVKWGQILEDDGWLSLPSELHRRFLFREVYCTNESTSDSIDDEGLQVFIRRVIERFDPRQLNSSKARNASGTVVYESQYQNEFYRAAGTILPRSSIMSPNVGPLFGAKGYLDYLLFPHRWGFELLVDGSKLKDHKKSFSSGGVYDKLIQDNVVSEYAILDFRTKPLVKASPGMLHIVFSEDFKKATLHPFGSQSELLDIRGIALEN